MMNSRCTCSVAFRDQYPDPTTHLWHCNIWAGAPDGSFDRLPGISTWIPASGPNPYTAYFDLLEAEKDAAVQDLINAPTHYTAGGMETIDFIEAKELGFHLGNVVKYVSRAGRKGESQLEDLEKARWYLDRHISNVKGAQ